ncbi:MAG: glycosyltransferase family 4 protein, partial [Actinobacteria bacterium]|nr:glycosyltransferase family 4 protein [Actinomycetota bacterium]
MAEYRLFVDIQTIQSLRFGDRGIPRFATEVSRALLAAHAPVAAIALNPLLPWPRRIHPDLAAAPQLTWNTGPALRRARAGGPVATFVISPFEGARPAHGVLAAHTADVPQMVMVHDLIPEVVARHDPASDWGRMYARRRQWAGEADVVICPSEHTRRDVIERWAVAPEQVAVIGEAASPFFCAPGPEENAATLLRAVLPAINRPFVLCVSGWDTYKNTETLIEAWSELDGAVRREHQLVIACTLPDEGREAWRELARRRGIGDDEIVLTGFVEDEVLRALYRAAALFVLPSHYEGFGLPVLEAVNCGATAITSDASSLPEIIEWPAATFPPNDTGAVADRVEQALSDSAFRAELAGVCRRAAERHTWRRVVDRLLAARTLLPDPATARPHRLRIALVGA